MDGREVRTKYSKYFSHVGSYLKRRERQCHPYEKETVDACRTRFKDVGKYMDFICILPVRFRIVDHGLFVSVCPMSVHEFRTLKEFFKVKVIINLNFSTINEHRYYTVKKTQLGISLQYYDMDAEIKDYLSDFLIYHFPVPDGCTPNDDQLKKIREVLDHHLVKEEENVLIVDFSAESIPWTVAGNYLVHYRNTVRIKEFIKRLPKTVNLSESQHQLLHQNWNDSSETLLLLSNNLIYVMKLGTHEVEDLSGGFSYPFFGYSCLQGNKGRILFKRNHSLDRKMTSEIRKKLSFEIPVQIGNATFLTYQSLGREMERVMNIMRFKSGNESEEDLKFYMEFLLCLTVQHNSVTYQDHQGIERTDRKKIQEKIAFEERKKSILGRIEEEKIYNLRLDKLSEVFGIISEKIVKNQAKLTVLQEKRSIVRERRNSFTKRVNLHERKHHDSMNIKVIKDIQRDEENVFLKKGKKLNEKEGEIKRDLEKLEKREQKLFTEIHHLQEESRNFKVNKDKQQKKRRRSRSHY